MLSTGIERVTWIESERFALVNETISTIDFSTSIPSTANEVTNGIHRSMLFDRSVLIEMDTEMNALSDETVQNWKRFRYAKISARYLSI